MKIENPRIGSSLDDFLREEGIFDKAWSMAIDEARAWRTEQIMKRAVGSDQRIEQR